MRFIPECFSRAASLPLGLPPQCTPRAAPRPPGHLPDQMRNCCCFSASLPPQGSLVSVLGSPTVGVGNHNPIPLDLLVPETSSGARCAGPGDDSDPLGRLLPGCTLVLWQFRLQLREEVRTYQT